MTKIFFDESIHQRGNFIMGAFIFSKQDLDQEVSAALQANGFDPNTDEYKSGLRFSENPNLKSLRRAISSILKSTKFALMVCPIEKRSELGMEVIKAVAQFIKSNNWQEKFEIFIDQGIVDSVRNATQLIHELYLEDNVFHFEQNSKSIRGLQVADLAAHSYSTILLETLGLVNKSRKAVEFSPDSLGYLPETDINIGFELWAKTRRNFICHKRTDKGDRVMDDAYYQVEPYGLYVSPFCNQELAATVRIRFSENYLGCIH